jgi:hypothetical protein
VAAKRREVLAQVGPSEEPSDAAEKLSRGNVRVVVKRIEQSVLVAAVLSHHAAAYSVPASS